MGNGATPLIPAAQTWRIWSRCSVFSARCSWAALAVGLLVGLVLYIFESLGLYRMAGKCRMRYSGLVFIPFVNLYYLGRLAQRGAVAYGKKALPFHVLLPLGSALTALLGGGLATAVTVVGARWIIGFGYRYVDEDAMLGFFGIVLVVSALLVLIALATAVFEYMALYQVYRLFVPENAAVYLVLSILVPVTMPFFLFAAGGREPGGCPASRWPLCRRNRPRPRSPR